MRSERKRYFLRFLLCALTGALLRLALLGRVPWGLNHDEASIGYDAWTLAHYGIDRNGYPWPVYPITWGSGGGSPLMVYLTVLSTKLFGRSAVSLRLAPALLGALTPPLLGLMPLASGTSPRDDGDAQALSLGLFLTFLAAINPWHLMMSRWALDANTLPFFLGLALVSFLWASGTSAADAPGRRLRHLRYLLSAALFALCPYAYGSATIVIPVSLVLLAAFAVRAGRMDLRELLTSALVFSLVLSPLALFLGRSALGLPAIVTPFFSIPALTAKRSVFFLGQPGALGRIFDNIRYLFIFLTVGAERDELLVNVLPGYAQMYRFTFPLTLGGLLLSLGRLREKRMEDACILILSGVTLAFSLFIELDINRLTLLLVPMLYLQALALQGLWTRRRRLGLLVCGLLSLSCVLFCRDYFGPRYASLTHEAFMPGYPEAVERAKALSGGQKEILSTYRHLSAPFMIALYASETPPQVFLDSVVWRDETEEFRIATRFAGYRFGLPEDLGEVDLDRQVLILHQEELEDLPEAWDCEVVLSGDYATVGR